MLQIFKILLFLTGTPYFFLFKKKGFKWRRNYHLFKHADEWKDGLRQVEAKYLKICWCEGGIFLKFLNLMHGLGNKSLEQKNWFGMLI